MNTEIDVHRTFTAHLHIVSEGKLPALHANILQELITANGVTTQKLITLCRTGLVFRRNADEKVTSAEITLPCRKDKYLEAKQKAALPPVIETRPNKKGSLIRKKYYQKGNSYGIVRFAPETGMFTVRVFDRYEGAVDGIPKIFADKLPASFLQAIFISFLELPLSGLPDIVVKPALKQTAEQILSYILLTVGETQDAEAPSVEERHPLRRLADWQAAVLDVVSRTEPFFYEKDPKRKGKTINVTPEWMRFVHSPFPRRLPLKVPPELFGVFWRQSQGGGKEADRLYLAFALDGAGSETTLGKLIVSEKLSWWRNHLESFRPLPFSERFQLKVSRPLLVVPLEYDRQGRFAEALGDPLRKMCLLTLKETKNFRRGRKNHPRNERLQAGNLLWRADFATSKEVTLPQWSGKVLGIHFRDDPVVTWTLIDREGNILEQGRLEGNPIIQQGLSSQELIQTEQKQGRWVGDRTFREKIKNCTYAIAREIVGLAASKDAWIALEDISWVDKRSGNALANRRFSLWNFSRLGTRIEWLGLDNAAHNGKPAPVAARVSDYLTRFTCPRCGACRKAKQKTEEADTVRTGGTLLCRKCGWNDPIPDFAASLLVARKGNEVMLKKCLGKSSLLTIGK